MTLRITALAATFALSTLAAQSPTPAPAPAPVPTRSVTFTTDEGTWMSVDVSPDGRVIAFDLLGDIYTVPIGGGAAQAILKGRAFQTQPRYSHDGGSILYISDESGSDNVWVSAADGSHPKAVTTLRRATMLTPEWSADGRSVFVTVIDDDAPRPIGAPGAAELWRFEVATGQGTKVAVNAAGPGSPLVSTPSPGPYGAHAAADGRALYYTSVTPRPYGSRNGGSTRVVKRDLESGREEPVWLEGINPMKPRTSPDGRWLAYIGERRSLGGLRLKDLATGAERTLQHPMQRSELEARSTRDVFPNFAWTPDSQTVVAAFGGHLHAIDARTGDDHPVPFTASVAMDTQPSPDVAVRVDQGPVRSRMVYQPAIAMDGRVAFSTLGRIYVTETAGGIPVPRRLTKVEHPREFMPSWSPDGRSLVYVTWTSDGGYLWRADADGRTPPTRLSDAPGFWADPAWSPDGSTIVALRAPVGSARTQPGPVPPDAVLVRVPAGGGPATTIAPGAGLRHPHFTADATRVFLSAPDGLVSFALTGAPERRVHATLPPGAPPAGPPVVPDVRISPDGEHVGLLSGERLFRFDVPVGATTPFALDPAQPGAVLLTAGAPNGFTWMGNGAWPAWVTGATLHRSAWGVATAGPVASAGLPSQGFVVDSQPLVVEVPRATPSGSVVLRGARVITMRGREVLDNADVLVANNRIAAVGAKGAVTVPEGVRVVDVSGKVIVPGFVDMHAHWSGLRAELLEPEAAPPYANLAFGITTVRDPQTTPDIFAYADLADAGEMPSPRIYSTGPGIFANRDLRSLDDTRKLIARYHDDYGTRYLKSYMPGNRQQRQWIVQASRDFGMITTTEGGADAKANLTHAIDGFSGQEHSLPTPLYRDAIELMARTRITYTPTLLVAFGAALPIYRLLAEERPYDDPKAQRFFPPDEGFQRWGKRLLAFPEEEWNYHELGASATAVVKAGGRVAVGGHGEAQGLSNHWEMRLLAESGMAAHDVLRAATLSGAEGLGLAQDLGSIEAGKLADLVVLDRNPLDDIRATTSIRYVMKNGMLYYGDTLETLWPAWSEAPATWWQRRPEKQAATATIDASVVDAVVRDEMDRYHTAGIAVAVMKGDQVALSKGYGLANIEQGAAVGPETMFESGSVGKMFTGAGILALAEDGKVKLGESVRTYLPEAPGSWQPITLRHLLSHTSGIPDYTGDTLDYRRAYTEADLLKLSFGLTLEYPAGTRFNYSNTEYVLLGIIMSRVTGHPYWEFLRERVFTPAGMPTARVISEADLVPHRASGYQLVDGVLKHQNWVSPELNTTADGSLLLSLNDLIPWARALRARSVLSKASWGEALSPARLTSGTTFPYGFGWFLDSLNGKPVHQHGGAWQGFHTQLSRYEGSDLTVIVLANTRGTNVEAIANHIAAAIDPALIPPRPASSPIPDIPARAAYVKSMIEKAARGELALADFEFIRQTIVARMGAALGRTLGPLGAIKTLDLLSAGTEGDDAVLLYRVTLAHGSVNLTVKLGPKGRLTWMQPVRVDP